MTAMTLGQALAAHRATHPGCDRHCQDYLNIARAYITARERWQGPAMACTILSVREPELED